MSSQQSGAYKEPSPQELFGSIRNGSEHHSSFMIKVYSRYIRINPADIYLIKGLSDYVQVYTDQKCYVIHSTMQGILQKLPAMEFIRVQKSYIVRLDRIMEIRRNILLVKDSNVPIGRTYKSELMLRLNFLF